MIFPSIGVEAVLSYSVKVTGLSVAGSIALLNVALIDALVDTDEAPLAGVVRVIVGALASGPKPVVKVQVKSAASEFSARSLTSVVIVAVNNVLAARSLLGVNVAVVPIVE